MGDRLLRYIALFFILTLWHSNASAYLISKTTGGADIKWFTSSTTYYINSSGGPSNDIPAMQAAMRAWTAVIPSYFSFVYGGTTTNSAYGTYDSSNIVCYGPMGLTGTLAENTFWYDTSSGQLVDSDIKFNTDYAWSTDGSPSAYDIQNVGTHELGHSLSLADLYNRADSEKTMYGYAAAGETKKRTLDQDDINGITYLYPDITAPAGTITINSGASYTTAASVTLTLTCTDSGSGCSEMRFSNDNSTWSTPEAYATSKSWPLDSGDGTKTVYAKFKDGAGNWSGAFTDTIILDTTAPATTASPAGGTYTSAQSVTLPCNDGSGSGCANRLYCLGAGCTPITSYSGTINIPSSNTLRFYSTDNAGNSESIKTETYTINIGALSITTSSLPSGTIGAAYSQTLTATGGMPPYTWSISSGNLPNGLNLNNSTGAITGPPSTSGTFNFIIQVTDANSDTATKNFSITIQSFNCRILRTPPEYFSAIQAAYDYCSDDDTIQCQAVALSGDVLCDTLNMSVTLKGGYDANFTSNPGYTTINGTLTISNGTVTVEKMLCR